VPSQCGEDPVFVRPADERLHADVLGHAVHARRREFIRLRVDIFQFCKEFGERRSANSRTLTTVVRKTYFCSVRKEWTPVHDVVTTSTSARLLLQVVRDARLATRADLADATGLSAAAVTRAVAGLLDAGLVVELGPVDQDQRAAGRPATRVALATPDRAPGSPLVVALHVGADVVEAALSDLDGTVLAVRSTPTHRTDVPERTLDVALDTLAQILEGVDRDRLLGAGVTVAGVLDAEERVVLHAPHLGWTHVPVADHVERTLALPCALAHNASAMALAEVRRGVGTHARTLAYVHSAGGVGGGLVLDGVLHHGAAHGAAELGHVVVDPRGPVCRCGRRGCLETAVSRPAIERLVAERLPDPGPEPLARLRAGVAAGEPAAVAVRDVLLDALAAGLDPLVALLAPDVVVLGGALGDLHDTLGERLGAALARYAVAPPLVAPAMAGARAGVLGATWTALDAHLYGPTHPALRRRAAHDPALSPARRPPRTP
jgi:predicted NBD/HSP70 family sugar kinase